MNKKNTLNWFKGKYDWKNYYGKKGIKRKLSYSVEQEYKFDEFMNNKVKLLNEKDESKIAKFVTEYMKKGYSFSRLSLIMKRDKDDWIVHRLMIQYNQKRLFIY